MANQQAPVLSINGLTKTYDNVRVVDDLSLSVRRGEVFGILGTNGAGKTTLVECAQGLRRPDTGTVSVLGCDPFTERPLLAGRVGSQLQESNLPERLRVAEAVRLFAADRAEAARAMEEWDLNGLAKKPFGALSGGQRQRLFLALALLNRPEVVFLDELTQGLDPDARRSVWRLIERISEAGTTVVLVTHFMDEAEALCDRVAVMNRGRLLAEGSPDELVDRFGRGVRVRFQGDSNDISWLDGLADVTGTRVVGDDVEACGSSSLINHVGHQLVERGRGSSPVRVHQPDLEDALRSILEPATVDSTREKAAIQ